MLSALGQSHALPVFEGRQSRRHRRHGVLSLRAAALTEVLRTPRRPKIRTFMQFAGFPRSGHSIVGSIIGAHPQAVVSHELDALGLFEAGFTLPEVLALVRRNAEEFRRNGSYWNGFSYQLELPEDRHDAPAVAGDKKGDWTVRRLRRNPRLLRRYLRALGPCRAAWICVARNPYDNVATMSLRQGRVYDQLRIDSKTEEEFAARLRAQHGKRVAAGVSSAMVEDYASLCRGVATLKAKVPRDDWLELRHEELVAEPHAQIARLLEFLGLAREPDFVAAAAAIVAPSPKRTRHALAWPDELRQAVAALIETHDFLHGYRFDE